MSVSAIKIFTIVTVELQLVTWWSLMTFLITKFTLHFPTKYGLATWRNTTTHTHSWVSPDSTRTPTPNTRYIPAGGCLVMKFLESSERERVLDAILKMRDIVIIWVSVCRPVVAGLSDGHCERFLLSSKFHSQFSASRLTGCTSHLTSHTTRHGEWEQLVTFCYDLVSWLYIGNIWCDEMLFQMCTRWLDYSGK